MPRDPGTKEYTIPDGTYGVPDEVIESAKYNALLDDLRSDLSNPLPVEMGGTGSYSAETALSDLGAISTFFLAERFIGKMGWYPVAVPPTGWLVCNGQSLSRSEYATLFARIGTTFGGSGSVFNLPDLRGEFIRSLDLSRGVDAARSLGSAQTDDNKAHSHTGTTSTDGAHTHGIARYALVTSPGTPVIAGNNVGYSQTLAGATTTSAGDHTHTVTIGSTGSEFRPRNVALTPCILAFLPSPS